MNNSPFAILLSAMRILMKIVDAVILFFLRTLLFVSFIVIAVILTWRLLYDKPQTKQKSSGIVKIKVTSPAFQEGKPIPKKYSCDGDDINPALVIGGVPREAKSLALILDDPDGPAGVWTHWLIWNLAPSTRKIKEHVAYKGLVPGTNSGGKIEYSGPCPPEGTHHYYFRIYALDTTLELPQGVSRTFLEEAMKDHVIGKGSLMGTYSR